MLNVGGQTGGSELPAPVDVVCICLRGWVRLAAFLSYSLAHSVPAGGLKFICSPEIQDSSA